MPVVRLHPALLAVLLGVLLALTFPPLPTGVLAPLVLAVVFLHASQAKSPEGVAGRLFWTAAAMSAVHLWWLTAFLGNIFHMPLLGVLALALFVIEGGFYALMGYLVARLIGSPLGRVWGIAGSWIVLEWLRFIGPFAFPWPTLGYSFLGNPMIQIADLGGVLLVSVLISATAAALVSFWQGRAASLWVMVACWLAALSYGLTRSPAPGTEGKALLQRTMVDVFAKAGQYVPPEQQFQLYNRLTVQNRQAGEVPIWTETAIQDPALLVSAPAGGIYGINGGYTEHANRAIAWDGRAITSQNDKARPVPFGEYFPLRQALGPIYSLIERGVGFRLESTPPAKSMTPLTLNGVQYGTYVCYDSVFPWVARQLTHQGANVLVNISNDGWYAGWGVQQHFMMGRVRAIENRRWIVRSVNEGIAAVINDLGQPVQTLDRGEDVIHARFKVLSGQTLYNQVGDWPALILAGLMVVFGVSQERRSRLFP